MDVGIWLTGLAYMRLPVFNTTINNGFRSRPPFAMRLGVIGILVLEYHCRLKTATSCVLTCRNPWGQSPLLVGMRGPNPDLHPLD